MKVAFVVPYVPNRIRIRSYNLIVHLRKQGVEVTVFTLGSSPTDARDAEILRSMGVTVIYRHQPLWRSLLNCIVALPSSLPFQAVYSWNRSLANQLREQIKRGDFDLVHVEHLRGSRYADFVKSSNRNLPVIWDSVDSISHLFRQASEHSKSFFGAFASFIDLKRTERAEGRLITQFDHVLVTSVVDQDALLSLVPEGASASPIAVLPNGVDLDYFQPPTNISAEPDTVVFSGKMSYHANIAMALLLAQKIMPLVWRKRPSTRLLIAGKDPAPEIRKLTRNPLITVTGSVDDLRPYLWKATIAVVPLIYGAGIQNKILEAMAAGLPVVSSAKTLPSLQAVPEKDLLVAETPDEFSAKIVRLLEDEFYRSEIGKSGMAYVREFHDWDQIAVRLIAIYRQAIETNRQAAK